MCVGRMGLIKSVELHNIAVIQVMHRTVQVYRTYIDSNNETKEQTAFINCVAWGKLGESIGNLRKGNRVFVEGRLQTRSYETQDGQKRYVTEVVANFVGTSITNDETASSNFDSFEQPQDENIPF